MIPIGGDSVTNDIALGARTSIDVAEKLKINYSQVGLDELDVKPYEIPLSDISQMEE